MRRSARQPHTTDILSPHRLDLRGRVTPARARARAERERLLSEREREREGQRAAKERTAHAPALRIPKSERSHQVRHTRVSSSPLRVTALVLMFVLSGTLLFEPPASTSAIFADNEESHDNKMTTGLVDYLVTSTATPFMDMATGTPTTSSEFWNVGVTPNATSNPFYYFASSTNFHGDLDLCADITVIATLQGEVMYDGPLTDFKSGTTTVIDEWEFEFSDYIGQHPAATCHFDVDFNGWQTRHNLEFTGFSDTETVGFWLTDPSMLITKVFFDKEKTHCIDWWCKDTHYGGHSGGDTTVIHNNTATVSNDVDVDVNTGGNTGGTVVTGDASSTVNIENTVNENTTEINFGCYFDCDDHDDHDDHDSGDGTEWVELYNQTNVPINIDGWQLCDNNECDTIPTSTPEVPPRTFVLIAESEEVLEKLHVPDDVITVIVEDGEIGDGLGDSRDMLRLVTGGGDPADQLNWGNPIPAWPNHSPDLWIPGLTPPDVPGVLARVPFDTDTDEPEDWGALGAPDVDLNYPAPYTKKWYVDSYYDISWDAENPNGDDDELTIDIYYKDKGGELVPIVLGTDNDGEHTWQVPDDCGDRIQVVVVATSPENVLLNDTDTSKMIKIRCQSHGCYGWDSDTEYEERKKRERGDDDGDSLVRGVIDGLKNTIFGNDADDAGTNSTERGATSSTTDPSASSTLMTDDEALGDMSSTTDEHASSSEEENKENDDTDTASSSKEVATTTEDVKPEEGSGTPDPDPLDEDTEEPATTTERSRPERPER